LRKVRTPIIEPGLNKMADFDSSELIQQLIEKLDSIERRLFRDNGRLSVQTRLDRHEQVIRGMLWALSVIGAALLTSAVGVLFMVVRSRLGG